MSAAQSVMGSSSNSRDISLQSKNSFLEMRKNPILPGVMRARGEDMGKHRSGESLESGKLSYGVRHSMLRALSRSEVNDSAIPSPKMH